MKKKEQCCSNCGDGGPLFIHSRCHPTSPTWAILHGDELEIKCAQCEKPIVKLTVVRELVH